MTQYQNHIRKAWDEMNNEKINNKHTIQTLGEEIANAISHGVGALLAIAATVVLIVVANFRSDAIGIVSACIYGASLILLYTFSSLYHSLTNPTAKKVFRIFDHCSIFLLILGSYTPVCLTMIRGATGWGLFGINAFCTVLGIVFNAINLTRWKKISMLLYLIMGWSVIFSLKPLLSVITIPEFILVLAGGLCYTLGIIFYKNKRFKYMHFVWHLFVLAGSVLQYFFVLNFYLTR